MREGPRAFPVVLYLCYILPGYLKGDLDWTSLRAHHLKTNAVAWTNGMTTQVLHGTEALLLQFFCII